MRGPGLASVVFCDAGQGDSVGIRLSSGEVAVVDCNIPGDAVIQRPPILSYLDTWARERGTYDLDLLCITHPDHDHFHGMIQVIDWVESHGGRVKRILKWAGVSAKDFDERLDRARRRGRKKCQVSALRSRAREFVELIERITKLRKSGTDLLWGQGFQPIIKSGGTRMFTVGPSAEIIEAHQARSLDSMFDAMLFDENHTDQSANELSTLLVLEVGEVSVFLTGDATAKSVSTSLKSVEMSEPALANFRANLLKLPHHGSSENSSEELWRQILREGSAVVVSAGNHAGYRHPSSETIGHVRRACPSARLYCTNICPALRPVAAFPPGLTAGALTGLDALAPMDFTEHLSDRYNGDCRFEIFADGQVLAEPQHSPLTKCPQHLD